MCFLTPSTVWLSKWAQTHDRLPVVVSEMGFEVSEAASEEIISKWERKVSILARDRGNERPVDETKDLGGWRIKQQGKFCGVKDAFDRSLDIPVWELELDNIIFEKWDDCLRHSTQSDRDFYTHWALGTPCLFSKPPYDHWVVLWLIQPGMRRLRAPSKGFGQGRVRASRGLTSLHRLHEAEKLPSFTKYTVKTKWMGALKL